MDGNDDKSPFDRIFSSFFGHGNDDFKDMTREMNEMMQQMNEMFRNVGDIDITVGYHPPGNRGPQYRDSPRDSMLKDPDSTTAPSTSTTAPSTITQEEITPRTRPFDLFSSPVPFFRFPTMFGGTDDRVPSSSDSLGIFGTSGEPDSTVWSSSGSSRTQSFSFNTGSGWTGTQIRTVRHSDGSTERIEKKTENGRTCTTVIRTDPQGITSSSTTCDRPAIGDRPSIDDSSKVSNPPEISSRDQKPTDTFLTPQPGMTSDETGFFNKLFGFNIFKPKKD